MKTEAIGKQNDSRLNKTLLLSVGQCCSEKLEYISFLLVRRIGVADMAESIEIGKATRSDASRWPKSTEWLNLTRHSTYTSASRIFLLYFRLLPYTIWPISTSWSEQSKARGNKFSPHYNGVNAFFSHKFSLLCYILHIRTRVCLPLWFIHHHPQAADIPEPTAPLPVFPKLYTKRLVAWRVALTIKPVPAHTPMCARWDIINKSFFSQFRTAVGLSSWPCDNCWLWWWRMDGDKFVLCGWYRRRWRSTATWYVGRKIFQQPPCLITAKYCGDRNLTGGRWSP